MLELIDLRRRYANSLALDGLSFAVPAGHMFGFLGPNGAGKTTAMRAIFGLTALDDGEVRWRGKTIDRGQLIRFGYMPEERGLYHDMTVIDQLIYLGRLHELSDGDARARAGQWCRRLGIDDRLEDEIEALSLGNQQRVQLAAALIHDPELLVLDEPFSGLDPVGVGQMSSVLRECVDAGATVLFSSHQLDLVEHLCDAVAIVDRGRLVAEGTVADLGRSTGRRLRVQVAGDRSGSWVCGLGSEASLVQLDEKSGRVLLGLGDDIDPQSILDAARRAGAVEHFAFEQPHLSEIFRTAVAATRQETTR